MHSAILLLALAVAGAAELAPSQLRPPELLADSQAEYPEALRTAKVGGEVALELTLDAEGAVSEVTVVASAHPELSAAAVLAARGLRFWPALLDGVPTAVRLPFVYRFEVPPSPPPAAPEVSTQQTERPAPAREEPLLRTVVRSRRDPERARVVLGGDELTQVAGTQGDPFRVIGLLPGVATPISGLAYPVVRGATPAATGYFLDGVRVPVLYHLFLGPSVVHPELIDQVAFHSAAPPARFGRLLGGAVEASLTPPRWDRTRASAYVDLINLGGLVEQPFASTGTSVTLAGRYSYTGWLLPKAMSAASRLSRTAKQPLVFDFYDFQGRIEQRVGAGSVRLLGFGSSDWFWTETPSDEGTFGTHQMVRFYRGDLRYRVPAGPGELELGSTWGLDSISHAYLVEGGAQEVDSSLALDTSNLAARAGYRQRLGDALRLELGADVDHRRGRQRSTASAASVSAGEPPAEDGVMAKGTIAGGYAQLGWEPDPRWSVLVGARVDHYHVASRQSFLALEPRLSVRHTLFGALALKAAAGLYHQPPSALVHLPLIDVVGLRSGLQRAAQLDLGAEWRTPELELSADVYFNPMLRTVELPLGRYQKVTDLVEAPRAHDADVSHGHSYGAELMVRRPLGGRWFGWISYSLQRSVRWTEFERRDEQGRVVGSRAAYLPFSFDQTHTLNAALTWTLPGEWKLGAAAHFRTGRPEDGKLTSYSSRKGLDPLSGERTWIPADRDQVARLPSYFRLDMRVSKAWTVESLKLEAYLDLLNVTLAREVIAFRYLGGLSHGAPGATAAGPLERRAESIAVVWPIAGLKAAY